MKVSAFIARMVIRPFSAGIMVWFTMESDWNFLNSGQSAVFLSTFRRIAGDICSVGTERIAANSIIVVYNQ